MDQLLCHFTQLNYFFTYILGSIQTLSEGDNCRVAFREVDNYIKDLVRTMLRTKSIGIIIHRANERRKIPFSFGRNYVVQESLLESSLIIQAFSMELLIL